jgi:hypothetical protein
VLSAEQAAFVQGDVTILLASRDERLICEVVRVFGAVVDRDRMHITLYLPDATSERTLANARNHPRLAAVFACPLNYQTLQINHVRGRNGCQVVRKSSKSQHSVLTRGYWLRVGRTAGSSARDPIPR